VENLWITCGIHVEKRQKVVTVTYFMVSLVSVRVTVTFWLKKHDETVKNPRKENLIW